METKSNLQKIASTTSMASLKDLRLSKPDDGVETTDGVQDLEYQVTLMYGRYSANLAEYARQEASRVEFEERQKEEIFFSKELQPYRGRISRVVVKFVRPVWDHTFARLGEDWVFLFFLGICMATLSFLIDYFVFICFKARMFLHLELLFNIHWTLQLFAWVGIPTLLVIFSATFCQWLAPSAAGSGIPEMKTILRGVMLKEYLTWKTLVAKIIGLATVLGSGLPLGKEGPVMHMAAILSTMLVNLLKVIKGVVDNEAHSTDLLAAACTMGVAVCYAAPIGGVLFSIEVTAVYFAVRNYWRGFFAAVVGALFYRLMSVWFMNEDTIYPIYKVDYSFTFPYDVVELLPFLCIGITCGFAGSLFVYLHRRYVIFMRQNETLKKILNNRRLLYPTIVSILISISTFPDALGQFLASSITTKQQILDLFSNVTWTVRSGEEASFEQAEILGHWVRPWFDNFHISLSLFQIISVIEIGLSSTLPVPSGILIPLFKCGAAFGRQVGEIMVTLYPHGFYAGHPIVPGAYAMVGAASFCAAITHTISISVIVFELTGEIMYVIPIMIGVLISNCISSLLQPSIYDSVIRIKKLPYLPDIVATTSDVYNIYVADIMVQNVKYIWYGITYMELKNVLKENRKLKYFPIVDKHETMILLGSIPRIELVRLLLEQISSDKRRQEAKRRYLEALKKHWETQDMSRDTKPLLDYENEIEDDIHSKPILKKLSETLSKSLSRSTRSLTKSLPRSQSESFHHSPEGSIVEKAEHSLRRGFTVPTFHIESDSEDEMTPPSSPMAAHLSDLFPSGPMLERRGSRFSVSKVPVSWNRNSGTNSDSTQFDGNNKTSDEDSMNSEETATDSTLQMTSPSLKKSASDENLNREQKSAQTNPVFARNRVKLKLVRSNSLENLGKKSTNENRLNVTAPIVASTPKKGILKRRNSLSLGSLKYNNLAPPKPDFEDTNYQTVSVVDSKLRNALEIVRKMKNGTANSMEFKLSQISLFKSKKKENGKKKEFDMGEEEREIWELQELSKEVDFGVCHIDASPFQLVQKTTLLRVHSLFSMLGINHAYVTDIGKLAGVVALKEVRSAIEGQYMGKSNATNSSRKENSPSTPPLTKLRGSTPPYSPPDPEAGLVFKRSISSSHA